MAFVLQTLAKILGYKITLHDLFCKLTAQEFDDGGKKHRYSNNTGKEWKQLYIIKTFCCMEYL